MLSDLKNQAAPFQFLRKSLRGVGALAGWAVGIGVIAAMTAAPSQAQTSTRSSLVPQTKEEVAEQDRFWTLQKFPAQSYMREYYWRMPDDTPAFFRDSLLQIVARSYLLSRSNFDGSMSRAWAAGGWIAYRSGLVANMFGVHAAYYTSQRLYGPTNEDGTRLLAPGQNAIGTLGQIYGRLQFGDQELRGGRQLVDTPLLGLHDNRMVPNSFEGVVLTSLPDATRSYDYSVGYLTQFKQRNYNSFVSLSDELAGADVADRGAAFGNLKFRPWAGVSFQLFDYYIQDFLNTAFGQAEYDFGLPPSVPNWMVGVNHIDQRSVGGNMLGSFSTYQTSAKLQMSYFGWTAFLAGSMTGDGSAIFSPFAGKPNYTDMQQLSFDNAGEKAFGGALEFNFGSTLPALAGLSVGTWYSRGWDARNPLTNFAIADRDELNFWLQYRPSDGPLKGFRFKTQYSDVHQANNVRPVQSELRMVVDYTVLFRPPPVETLALRTRS